MSVLKKEVCKVKYNIAVRNRFKILCIEETEQYPKEQTSCIMSKDGKLPFEHEDISKRWVEYISNLYNDNRDDMPTFPITSGENILKEEVQRVIKAMKDGKAMGTDKISTEMLRALDEENLDSLTQLCNIIYDSGHIPKEMEQSRFVTIPK